MRAAAGCTRCSTARSRRSSTTAWSARPRGSRPSTAVRAPRRRRGRSARSTRAHRDSCTEPADRARRLHTIGFAPAPTAARYGCPMRTADTNGKIDPAADHCTATLRPPHRRSAGRRRPGGDVSHRRRASARGGALGTAGSGKRFVVRALARAARRTRLRPGCRRDPRFAARRDRARSLFVIAVDGQGAAWRLFVAATIRTARPHVLLIVSHQESRFVDGFGSRCRRRRAHRVDRSSGGRHTARRRPVARQSARMAFPAALRAHCSRSWQRPAARATSCRMCRSPQSTRSPMAPKTRRRCLCRRWRRRPRRGRRRANWPHSAGRLAPLRTSTVAAMRRGSGNCATRSAASHAAVRGSMPGRVSWRWRRRCCGAAASAMRRRPSSRRTSMRPAPAATT